MDETTKRSTRKEIGKHLQVLRKKAGFSSAKAFAEKIGFNPNTYTQYEQGISGFNYEQAWEMADALQCSLDELGGREWPPGGTPELSADERGLVDSYRRMDDDDKPAFMTTARGLAYAGEAKKEVKGADAPVADEAMSDPTVQPTISRGFN